MTTQIEERLAEAFQKLDAINEIIFAAENAAMACDVVQPTIKMLSESDIKRIFDLSMHAESEASRTHPAEGGEGRDPHHDGATEWKWIAGVLHHRMFGLDRWDRCNKVHATPARIRMLCSLLPPPQTVAPERGEAKAVALPDRRANPGQDDGEHTGWTDYEIGLAHGWNECLDAIAATPQPTPAPSASNEWRDAMVYLLARVGGDAPVFAGNGANPTPQELSDEIYSTVCHLEDRARNAPSALRYRDPTIEDASKLIAAYWKQNNGEADEHDMLAALNAIGAKMAEGEG